MLRLDLTEGLHGLHEGWRKIAAEVDMADGDDLADDLVDDRALAATGRPVDEDAAAVQKAVVAEMLAQRPEGFDF